jgi:hypothetical protein
MSKFYRTDDEFGTGYYKVDSEDKVYAKHDDGQWHPRFFDEGAPTLISLLFGINGEAALLDLYTDPDAPEVTIREIQESEVGDVA